jgi:hypothetical protein
MEGSRVVVDLEQVTNTCFVVMPFHKLFETEYQRVIRPAIEQLALKCKSGQAIYSEQTIVQDIWKFIRRARLVVAELTDRNPNVMYEIGLAHAIGKPIILLSRNEADFPFDLRQLRIISYDPNDPFWGENLRSKLVDLVRTVLDTLSLAVHLHGITVEAQLPLMPASPISPEADSIGHRDFGGVWRGSWLSVRSQRKHDATLVIPSQHGRNFVATLTVTYIRNDAMTVVHETMTGSAKESLLGLTGVNYTYVQRGASSAYSLDSFELQISDDGATMAGKAILQNGVREVTFVRDTQY